VQTPPCFPSHTGFKISKKGAEKNHSVVAGMKPRTTIDPNRCKEAEKKQKPNQDIGFFTAQFDWKSYKVAQCQALQLTFPRDYLKTGDLSTALRYSCSPL
jgi:hypothetical protein